MKLSILVMLLSGFASVLIAQDIPQANVPSVVLNTFQSKFPNATDVDWELEEGVYKVEFKIGKRGHDLWIDKSGKIKKQKEDFPKSQLPAAISEKLKSDFSAYKIDDVDKIEQDGKVLYKVELDSPTGERDVWFNPDGSIHEDKKK